MCQFCQAPFNTIVKSRLCVPGCLYLLCYLLLAFTKNGTGHIIELSMPLNAHAFIFIHISLRQLD